MSTTELTIPSSNGVSVATDVQTFDEACEAMRDLQDQAGSTLDTIRKKGKELILIRFQQGVVARRAMDMPRDEKYGKKIVRNLAKRAGMHQRTLYRCVQFVEALPFGESEVQLKQWMASKEEEKSKALNWTYCRNWAKKKLRESEEAEEDRREREINELNAEADEVVEKAEALEKKAEKVEKKRQQDVPDEVYEARGVAYKANEVAQDLRRQAERLRAKGIGRIQYEKYLDHVRQYNCLVCQNGTKADPHHIISGGTGTKTHDFFTIPLCRKHHNEWHDKGGRTFVDKYNLRPWRAACYIMTEFLLPDVKPGTLQ